MAVVRPLHELDLADELRRHPDDVTLPHPRDLGNDLERRASPLERLQAAHEPVYLFVREARAAVADVVELAAAVDRENERAETPLAAAMSLRVAGDDELLSLLAGFHLEPVPAPAARLVTRVGPLGHDSFETLLQRCSVARAAGVQGLGEL